MLPAHSSLRCEFVCLPTHDSPDSALFRLVVVGGAEGEVPGDSGGGGVVHTQEDSNLLTLRAEVFMYECTCIYTLFMYIRAHVH